MKGKEKMALLRTVILSTQNCLEQELGKEVGNGVERTDLRRSQGKSD